jgi:hypothetical protein
MLTAYHMVCYTLAAGMCSCLFHMYLSQMYLRQYTRVHV